jgi:hypothetical protein
MKKALRMFWNGSWVKVALIGIGPLDHKYWLLLGFIPVFAAAFSGWYELLLATGSIGTGCLFGLFLVGFGNGNQLE